MRKQAITDLQTGQSLSNRTRALFLRLAASTQDHPLIDNLALMSHSWEWIQHLAFHGWEELLVKALANTVNQNGKEEQTARGFAVLKAAQNNHPNCIERLLRNGTISSEMTDAAFLSPIKTKSVPLC